MKKQVKKVLIILFIILLIIISKKILLKKYTIVYEKNNYKIKEIFQDENIQKYTMIITKKDHSFIYQINHNFHKNKKIVKEINTFKNNNLECIIPIYTRKVENEIYCNIDNQQVSIDYLLKSKNTNFKKIKEKIKKYKISFPNSSNIKKKYKSIQVYQDNISEKDIYYIWNYKGVYILDNNKTNYKQFLKEDIYDNIVATAINNYYVLLENLSVNGIEKIYYYDYKKNIINIFSPKIVLSKDTYINGIKGNLIYLTDKREKKQYILNIKKEKIERIDQDGTTYISYEDNKKIVMSKSDFLMKEQYFTNNTIIDNKIASSNDIRKENGMYYYLQDNKIYQALEKEPKKAIILLELEDIKSWYIQEDELLLLQKDTLYSYNEQRGLRKILKSNELNYNYKNIYKLGKK